MSQMFNLSSRMNPSKRTLAALSDDSDDSSDHSDPGLKPKKKRKRSSIVPSVPLILRNRTPSPVLPSASDSSDDLDLETFERLPGGENAFSLANLVKEAQAKRGDADSVVAARIKRAAEEDALPAPLNLVSSELSSPYSRVFDLCRE